MKILVLTSRYTATRDIIEEDFGRQIRLFEALAKYGHDISFFCADYRKHENRNLELHSIKVRIRPFGLLHFFGFVNSFRKTLRNESWDLVIATSDPLWGIIGLAFSKLYKIRFLYDLHDNYETYSTYKIPFFSVLDKIAIKKADLVSAVSYELKDKINAIRKDAFVIQNGADLSIFKPMDMAKCRKELGLQLDKKIIVYTGTIQRDLGINVLLEAFKKIRRDDKSALLVLAGRFYRNESRHLNLNQDGVLYLGSINNQNRIAKLVNASNLAVIPSPDNDFTRYCFPYKAAEYAACKKPIVATNVGDMVKIIRQDSLCAPNNPNELAEKLKKNLVLHDKRVNYDITKNTWKCIAGILDRAIKN